MLNFDLFETFAQVGAALAGFATIAGILQKDFTHRHNAFGVVQTSLLLVIFSLVPKLIGDLRISAFLFWLAWCGAWVFAGVRNARHAKNVLNADLSWPVSGSAFLLATTGSVLLLLVSLGFWPEQAYRFYSYSLMCALLTSCLFLWVVGEKLFYGESSGETD